MVIFERRPSPYGSSLCNSGPQPQVAESAPYLAAYLAPYLAPAFGASSAPNHLRMREPPMRAALCSTFES